MLKKSHGEYSDIEKMKPVKNGPDEREEEEDEDRSFAMEKNKKKGFRIDDILFSVSKNVDQDLYVQVTSNNCVSPQSVSPSSSYSSSNDDIPRLSPVSFISRPSSLGSSRYKINFNDQDDDKETFLPQSPARSEGYIRISSSLRKYENDCVSFPSSPTDCKKPRTSFTPDQIQTLEDSFNEKRYLNHTERMILASELNLTDCQIKTWFQNRRMKMKRQYKEAVEKGYLIPFHPYPFPRYSRLTPAHFASAPGIKSRHFLPECNSNGYSSSRSPTNCTCCAKESRVYHQESPPAKSVNRSNSNQHFMCYQTAQQHSPDFNHERRKIEQRRTVSSQYKEDYRKYLL